MTVVALKALYRFRRLIAFELRKMDCRDRDRPDRE